MLPLNFNISTKCENFLLNNDFKYVFGITQKGISFKRNQNRNFFYRVTFVRGKHLKNSWGSLYRSLPDKIISSKVSSP